MVVYRFLTGLRYAKGPVKHFVLWLFTSREFTNYTYDLTDVNKRYMAAFVSHVTGAGYAEAKRYIDELEQDAQLREHIRKMVKNSDDAVFADPEMRYGRRMGWYAIARAIKPRTIVETGVDKGLGACILAAALERNAQEGHPGRYCGTDINPDAGYLLTGEYAEHATILYGDSIDSLRSLEGTIDLFINDSDHSAEYEAREYETVEGKLRDDAVVIGDNAHCTAELLKFAERTGRDFLYFQEQPYKHWYRGAGIGVAYRKDV